jgi:hypothetical protein
MIAMTTEIATWFVADTADNETTFPAVGGHSSTRAFQNVYWRCIACFFAVSTRTNSDACHVFYTNTTLPVVDGLDLKAFLQGLKVEIVTLPITYRLPRSSVNMWGNQFYILDIIKHVAAHGSADRIIVLDSDCLFMQPVSRIDAVIDQNGCGLYTIDYPAGTNINGITQVEMGQALQAWRPDLAASIPPQGPHYHGGEIFAATRQACIDLCPAIDSLWGWRQQQGKIAGFKEEAHFLSLLYAALKFEPYTLNSHIRRIWTAFKFSTVTPADLTLDIWHLPAEKTTGFADLFGLVRRDALPSDPQAYRRTLARLMGVPHRSLSKYVRDFRARLAAKSRARLHRLSKAAFLSAR